MGQDNTSGDQYTGGYRGSTSQPHDTYSSQQYGQSQQQGYQQSFYGQQQQQQYSTYQPPKSAAEGSSAHDPTSTGMSARTEALLSNAFWWISGLIFFLLERKNRFVRFHAAQSFLFFGAVSLFYVVVRVIVYLIGIIPLLGGLLGFILNPVLACVTLIVLIPAGLIWLFLMIQSYRGKTVRLPIVSGYAESLVERFSPKKKTTP